MDKYYKVMYGNEVSGKCECPQKDADRINTALSKSGSTVRFEEITKAEYDKLDAPKDNE